MLVYYQGQTKFHYQADSFIIAVRNARRRIASLLIAAEENEETSTEDNEETSTENNEETSKEDNGKQSRNPEENDNEAVEG